MLEFLKSDKISESSHTVKLAASAKLQTEKDDKVVTTPPSPQTLLAIQTAMVENAKLVASDKPQTEKDNNVVTEPLSPRTLHAIQAAMVESSSGEELEDEYIGCLNMDRSVTGEGSVSPRTLQAIQQALSGDDEREEVVTVKTDGVLPERSEVKDFLLSSSDEEDQIPEVKEGKKNPVSTICLSNQVVMGDAECEQKSQESEKNHTAPKDISISRVGNYSCIDNTSEKGKERGEQEDSGSKMDLNSLRDEDINLSKQKPTCFPVQTNTGASIHAEPIDLSKNEENLKISENVEKVILQTEESVSEVQKDIRPFSEAKRFEEEREVISQSEDSDSDGMGFYCEKNIIK